MNELLVDAGMLVAGMVVGSILTRIVVIRRATMREESDDD